MNLLSIDDTSGDMLDANNPLSSVSLISYFNLANLYNNKDNYGLINYK
jgi:hypothetical protein